jgi:acetylserotonin N-methyltransferase
MEAHSSATAEASAAVLPLSGRERLLDMAGGSGCFSRALASAHPRLTCTVGDVPEVIALHKRGTFIEHALRGRVRAVEADLFRADTWPRGHDVVLLANVVHDWGPGKVATILRAAREALRPGGRCIIIEALLAPDRSGPLPAALYSVSMLLGDWRSGKQYTLPELSALLGSAGLADIEESPRCGPFHSAVIARRP